MNGPVYKIAGVAVAAALGAMCAAHADTAGRWPATSTASMAITGDIAIAGSKLTFGNGTTLQLTPVAERNGRWSPLSKETSGQVYKLTPPADPMLLNGNTLCGKPVTYIVLSEFSPGSLSLTAFTGTDIPRGFGDDSCAAYFYER